MNGKSDMVVAVMMEIGDVVIVAVMRDACDAYGILARTRVHGAEHGPCVRAYAPVLGEPFLVKFPMAIVNGYAMYVSANGENPMSTEWMRTQNSMACI